MKRRPFAVWFFSIYILLFSLAGILGGLLKGPLEKEVLIPCLVGFGLALWLYKPSIVALRILQVFLAFYCVGFIIVTFVMFFKQGLEVSLQTIIRVVLLVSFFGIPLIYSLRDKTMEQFK